MEIQTRQPQHNEIPHLRHIWSTVFNDGDESAYFDYYFDPKLCVTAIRGGVPVSAGYLLPAGNVIFGEISVPCAMIYGVATLPEYRGLGFGATVTRDLLSIGHAAGFPAIALCPSNDSLFEFYSERADFREWFYIHEKKYKTANKHDLRAAPEKIPHLIYSCLREELLIDIPHIKADERALLYQDMLCAEFSGGLFRIETSGGVSCAIVEKEQSGAILIKELLAPDGFEDEAIESIASVFPSNEYIVRTPVRSMKSQPIALCSQSGELTAPINNNISANQHQSGGDQESIVRRFGMLCAPLSLLDHINEHATMPWFGLAFD